MLTSSTAQCTKLAVTSGNVKHPAGGNIDVPRIAANCCPTNMHIVRVQRLFKKSARASVLEDFSFLEKLEELHQIWRWRKKIPEFLAKMEFNMKEFRAQFSYCIHL